MTLLILGAGGLLGRHLTLHLSRAGFDVVGRTHAELDISDPDAPDRALSASRPDLVINAAGLVSFDACEADPERSRRVNLDAPLRWAARCAERSVPFWTFSSDYVFDGSQRTPYAESDPPRPRSVYARHKAELESGMDRFPDHLVLRVSWVYGAGGKTFMSLIPGLIATRETLEVASGKLGSCLYAPDAARFVEALLRRRPTGLLNLVNAGTASWEGFAHRCLDRMRNLGLPVRCRSIREVPFQQLSPSGAGERPAYSVLDTGRLERWIGPIPSWEAAQDRFLAEFATTLAVAGSGDAV